MENSSSIRIGTVSSLNGSKARVCFPGQSSMVSAECLITKFPNRVTESAAGPQAHTHKEGEWSPKVGDQVIVAYAGGFNSSGYILGVI